jgi:signal transduction histidine kinase/DNA-binding response OmpR family regulator
MAVQKSKLLVVDDEQGIRDLLQTELSALGHIIDTASNGEEAIAKIKQDRYDLVLSDIKMPKADGIELLTLIKKLSPETEVIMITGYATVENAVEAMKQGAYDFVQKPFNMEEVTAIVTKALEKSELKTLIALYESSKAIFSSLKLEKLFPIMINLLKNVIKADDVAFLLFDHQEQLYLAAASFSLVYSSLKNQFITLGERLYADGKMEDTPVIFKHPFSDNAGIKDIFPDNDLKSIAAYPIKIKSKKLGALIVSRTRNHAEFSFSDMRNLSIFVSQIAQSIDNTKLYEKLEVKVSELESAHRQIEQARRQVVIVEKMSAVGHVAASLVSQLSGPLETLNCQVEKIIKKKSNPEDAKESAAKIKAESARCNDIINNLKAFSSCQKTELAVVDMNALIEEVLELIDLEYQNDGIRIIKELSRDIPKTMIDKNQIKQVILNLLVNAQQSFTPEEDSRHPEKTVTIKTSAAEGLVYLEINDNGCGIDSKNIDKVFTPFFTTKDPKKNIGLGLSISCGIVEQHNGKIHVKSSPKDGSSFIINLPAAN